jgi:hypothetical protein
MPHEAARPTPADSGWRPDTLSNEVLKFKVEDLVQEVEDLKRRMRWLEGRSPLASQRAPEGVDPAPGAVSHPDPC